MDIHHGLIFAGCGLLAGLLSGVLGIGGGIVLVPIIKTLGYAPVEAVATSSMAIVMTSVSGSIQNYRMGNLALRKVILLGLPSFFTAQIGVWLAGLFPAHLLLAAFSIFLIINIFLANFRKILINKNDLEKRYPSPLEKPSNDSVESSLNHTINPFIARIFTGSLTGILAGLFGVGGGVILVPLQMLLLGEKIKSAIQTSLGVIVMTSISAAVGHATKGNVLFLEGIILGIFGLIGAQLSTRFLPRLPNRIVNLSFSTLLVIISIYMMSQAYEVYLLEN
ncbi:MAG: sulfite exporter TauE/SafE family protein [Xenococcaceae cyanobacterium MO_188.B19]|nr:sulfite exporter TauE/SafE family protein [Xenococcaceae cyanobacterium MO_188.B19]